MSVISVVTFLSVFCSFSVLSFLPAVDGIVIYVNPCYGPDLHKPENLGLGILHHVDW